MNKKESRLVRGILFRGVEDHKQIVVTLKATHNHLVFSGVKQPNATHEEPLGLFDLWFTIDRVEGPNLHLSFFRQESFVMEGCLDWIYHVAFPQEQLSDVLERMLTNQGFKAVLNPQSVVGIH